MSPEPQRRILILSQWFPPEHAPIGYMLKELGEHLSTTGFQVEVVTGFPNHPTGRVQPPYAKQWRLVEQPNNITITRLWLFTSERRSLLTRALNFLSFVLRAFLYLLTCPKPALVFAVLQPLPVGVMLLWVAKLRGFKLIFNVQDLHPDVVIDLGLVRNPVVIRLLKWMERKAYAGADALAVICDGFKQHVRSHGAVQPVAVIPNWIDVDEIHPDPAAGAAFLTSHGLNPNKPVVLYAGTIGHVSGAQVVIDAARQLPGVQWLFVGEGPVLADLKRQAHGMSHIYFLPFQPRAQLNAVQNCAALSLVSLLPGKGTYSVPSKVLGYMAAGKPVLASVDANSETARLVDDAECGWVVPAGDANALAQAVQQLLGDPSAAGRMGLQGRLYLETRYSRRAVCTEYETLFRQILT
ncbi:glycosyltransferase family 4 protein [Limnobacter humi]|uniref:Glycosyltransferase family 4 protein n=1 Tax=Limnobacter humi TaxID=1778671 RepID=A0ABT1WJN5_9BURK|nr:glycosyltransferase family 4 protein [Limnobacter humi]MCQ8897730.1 glycosyltransferase family 4 protein [Limnobacter humi]